LAISCFFIASSTSLSVADGLAAAFGFDVLTIEASSFLVDEHHVADLDRDGTVGHRHVERLAHALAWPPATSAMAIERPQFSDQ
jgi:hypothetical protein